MSLRLKGTEFERVLALGGSAGAENPGSVFGAAFTSPTEGWLGSEALPVHITEQPQPSRIQPWPVPFRHALLAVAPQPGAPAGSMSSEALAVGDSGEVARYKPGVGWLPETLFGPGGRRETGVRLRAVAWPTPNRAYAVGDESTAGHPQMWLWRGETNLWEPDPAIPLNFRGNLLGIAFDPNEPARGYAVGSGGVLLRYGKTWTQEPLPAAAQGATLTSIAFAGSEALVAFNRTVEGHGRVGGLLVNGGSGWQVEEGAAAADGAGVPTTVAGLPDGGAAFATTGGESARVYERDGPGAPWQAAPPLPQPATAPGSLGLFRESGALRVLAAGLAPIEEELLTAPPPPGFPPTLERPLPVLSSEHRGIVRQTAVGWSDEQHELNPVKEPPGPYSPYDAVYQPDPIAAVLVSADGSEGWALGGIIAGARFDTSDVEHYEASGEQPTPEPEATPSPPTPEAGQPPYAQAATFAIGGDAQCAAPCFARAGAKIGPDVWLEHALASARAIPGVRAFLYTGARLSAGHTEGTEPRFPFSQEFERYGELAANSPLPFFAAPSPTDLGNRPTGGTEAGFETGFGAAFAPLGSTPSEAITPVGQRPDERLGCVNREACEGLYYAFDSSGTGGPVRVIVLDDTRDVEQTQLEWLEGQLAEVDGKGEPAIVIGNANLTAQEAAHDPEARNVVNALVAGHALAYFYDTPEENVKEGELGNVVKTYGSGTLGYIEAKKSFAQFQASGFLLAEINANAGKPEVHVQLIPNIEELAIEAENGTLLRTSEVARFAALARRPRAGNECQRGACQPTTSPYIQLPSECIPANCPMKPEYEFKSSNEQVGGFVERETASPLPNVPETVNGHTVPSSAKGSKSGLFCAYEHGETMVTVIAGGLESKIKVVVQAGSKRAPCVPPNPRPKPTVQQNVPAPPPPAPGPTPAGATPSTAPLALILPVPPPALLASPTPPRAATPSPFVPLAQPIAPLLAFVPPPLPTPARPSPPSGTSAVTSPVEAAEKEEEREEAPESVSAQAAAYSAPEHEPSPVFLVGLVVIAAFAGASIGRRRRGGREVRIAPATLNGIRQQQRLEHERRRRR